jgi:rubrerythrin
MEFTDEAAIRIGEIAARKVIDRLGVVPSSYRKPATVQEGLQDSQHEELTAAGWYRARAIDAEKAGDKESARLYYQIAKEEEEHFQHFSDREKEVYKEKPTKVREIVPVNRQ